MKYQEVVGSKSTIPSASAEISSHLLAAAYRALPVAMMAQLVLVTATALVLGGASPQGSVFVWWLASGGVAALRWLSVLAFTSDARNGRRARFWYWVLFGGSLVSALLWGVLVQFLWPPTASAQALIMTVLAGVVASGVISLSPVLSAALPFPWIILVPLVLRYLFDDAHNYLPVVLVLVLFAATVSASTWRNNRTLRSAFAGAAGSPSARRDLDHEAFFDPLTNLPNRRYFLDRLQQEFSRAKRHERAGALLFLDLDNFKPINDTLGHHVGDLLLQQVAARLRARFRDEDVAGRLGGDEFVVLLADVVTDPVSILYEVEKVAAQLKELLTEPYRLEEHDVSISVSIGVALFPGEAESYRDVLKNADTAMYRAKAQGRNSYQFYLPGMQEEDSERLALEKDLRHALVSDQLEMFYQVQFDQYGEIYGMEALARWDHPELGEIPPDRFVRVAEESALTHDLHDWVVQQVCLGVSQIVEHCGLTKAPIVSINVSARSFNQSSFEQHLLEQITRAGIPGEKLCLEISETAIVDRTDSVIEKIVALRRSGLLFAVDDFGTGCSPLLYLQRLPVDVLKIDRTLIGRIAKDDKAAVIVETMLSMANHLDIRVCAEGVDDEVTASFLRERGCQLFQGWLFSRAEPLEEVLGRYFPAD